MHSIGVNTKMVSSVQIQVTMKNDTMLNIKRDKYMHKITIDIIYTILQFFSRFACSCHERKCAPSPFLQHLFSQFIFILDRSRNACSLLQLPTGRISNDCSTTVIFENIYCSLQFRIILSNPSGVLLSPGLMNDLN